MLFLRMEVGRLRAASGRPYIGIVGETDTIIFNCQLSIVNSLRNPLRLESKIPATSPFKGRLCRRSYIFQ